MNLTQIALDLISNLGYTGLFLGLFLDSFGIPIPSEVLVPLATVLALQGRFSLAIIFFVAVLAQVAGGLTGYYIGRYAGEPFLEKYGRYVLISRRDLARTRSAFDKYGRWFVMIGRCIPVIRGFIAYPAGITEMPIPTFLIYTAIGSAFWTAILMAQGLLLKNNLALIDSVIQKFSYLIIGLIIIYVAWHIWHVTRPTDKQDDSTKLDK
jgi:membrane protein DedA with SNARE-associated domain